MPLRRTSYRQTTPLSARQNISRKFGHWDCAIHGVFPSTELQVICGSAMWARWRGKKLILSLPALVAAIMGGVVTRASSLSIPRVVSHKTHTSVLFSITTTTPWAAPLRVVLSTVVVNTRICTVFTWLPIIAVAVFGARNKTVTEHLVRYNWPIWAITNSALLAKTATANCTSPCFHPVGFKKSQSCVLLFR